MRGNRLLTLLLATALLAVALAPAAYAGGPLLLYDPATRTPYAYPGAVSMYTDLDNLGSVANATADGLVSYSAGQWTGVTTSSFSAAVAGDFTAVGLPNITSANANTVIGANNGGGIHVVYDHDGTIITNFFGAPPGVLGIASPDFASGANLTESWMVLNGASINAGDLPGGSTWNGVITHEMGHAINLAHTQTNGGIIFFGDGRGPDSCTPPYPTSLGLSATETMYPYIDVSPGSTGFYQKSVEHPDDTTALSEIYPAAGYPGNFGTIEGTVFESDGVTPALGVNVIARNIANPFLSATSSLSGDYTQGDVGADGFFRLTGLTPGATYVIYIDEIVQGGYSTPPRQPLGAPEEFWNNAEGSYDLVDPPCDYTTLLVAAGQTITTDFILNGASPAAVIGVNPAGFSFSVPINGTDSDVLDVQNLAGAGAQDLIWTLVDVQPAFGGFVDGAMALDPSRVRIDRAAVQAPTDSRDPALLRQCTDCGREHVARTTPLDFGAADKAVGTIVDGGFELGPNGGGWNEFSSNFGTPICDAGTCGTGGLTGARTGTYWCWFGGIGGTTEIGSVSQNVTIPAAATTLLEFYLDVGGCDSANDFVELRVDGNTEWVVDGGGAACDGAGYVLVSVDISSYADGGTHTVEFYSETVSTNAGATNFFIDDVSLSQSLTDCAWLSAAPLNGVTAPGASSPVNVFVDATGLAPGIYVCELRISSNDPVNPMIAVPVDLEVTEPQPDTIEAFVAPVNALNGPVSVFSLPDGGGNPLTQVRLWSGVPGDPSIIVDATIGVRLVDNLGNPVVGFPAESIRLQAASGGWSECADTHLTADYDTDANGETIISGALFAGGQSGPGELMQVVVDDPTLIATNYPGGLAGLEYWVNSADIDHNFLVDILDLPPMANAYGTPDYKGDFLWDGITDILDLPLLAGGYGASCPVVVASGATGPQVAVGGEIGVVFDLETGATGRSVTADEPIDAYVVLRGAAADAGVAAFDARVRVSENVRVLERGIVGDGINVATGADFVVGLTDVRRAGGGRDLVLARLRVTVTDAKPAHFWLEPSAASGGTLPTVAGDDRIYAVRPVSGDVAQPVAGLNDKAFDDGTTPAARRLSMSIAPNPFNPMTEIRFALPTSGAVELRVFDARGKLVTVLANEVMAAGEHTVVWNGTDRSGHGVASGVYFSSLRTADGTLLEKMLLMK